MKTQAVVSLVLIFSAFPGLAESLEEKEQGLGYYTDRGVILQETILVNDAVSERISEIGSRVAQAANVPDINFSFRVVNNKNINACSAAGGFIYINTGLLDILESEDELAAVLAHEIAHAANHHQLDFLYAAHRRKVAGEITGLILGTALAAAGAYGQSYGGYNYNYNYYGSYDLVDLGMDLGMALGGAMGESMIKGYGKKKELEADAFAVQYTTQTDYDPYALVSTFKKLISIRDDLGINERNYVSSLINAEPGLEERIRKIDALVYAE